MTTTLTPAGDLGDKNVGDIFYAAFNTHQTSMAPFTLAGTPSLSCYKDDGLTQSTAGLTLTADFDGKTGLNMVKVDTSADGTFYATGHDFTVVIEAGSVNSISAIGYIVARFSLGKGVNVVKWLAGTIPAVAITGVPLVDVKYLLGIAQSLTDLKDFADTGYDPATHLASTTVGELGTAAKDDVKDAIIDFMDNTSYSDIGQEAFDDTPTMSYMIRAGYKRLKNKVEETATALKIYNSAGSVVDQLATVSNNGTTASKGKIGTGP